MGNGYPSNPSDLDRASGDGREYIFNEEDDTWKNHGSAQEYPLVGKENDGLVSPSLYNKLVKIKDYPPSNLKLTPNKTYFYNFISTDKFVDFTIENNHLRIEANRGSITRRLVRFPCHSQRGRDGIKGKTGRNGVPASNEKLRPAYSNGLFEVDVNTPLIDQPISLRGFDYGDQIFEAIINLNGSVEDEDDGVSDIQLIGNPSSGKVTIKGRLNDTSLRFKIRQIGPKGKNGPDGVNYVQVRVDEAPTNGQFTEVIGMLWYNASINSFITKRSSINELLNNVINVTPKTNLPTGDIWAAVEIASKPRKAVEYHQFLPAITKLKINLPNYTPLSGCYNQNRYSLGYLQPDDNIPFTIIGDPFPEYTNCKEPFWFCGNTGDTCDDLIDVDPKELNPPFDTSSSSGTSSSSTSESTISESSISEQSSMSGSSISESSISESTIESDSTLTSESTIKSESTLTSESESTLTSESINESDSTPTSGSSTESISTTTSESTETSVSTQSLESVSTQSSESNSSISDDLSSNSSLSSENPPPCDCSGSQSSVTVSNASAHPGYNGTYAFLSYTDNNPFSCEWRWNKANEIESRSVRLTYNIGADSYSINMAHNQFLGPNDPSYSGANRENVTACDGVNLASFMETIAQISVPANTADVSKS